jgi:acyl carrier protein
MWVEKTFDLQVGGSDLDFVNFSTVDAIVDFVDRKRIQTGGTAWTSN